MSIHRLLASMTIPAPTDGAVFLAYVAQVLCPKLRSGDVGIRDKLSAHQVAGVREQVQAAGAELIYLPPYSPDLNPIELAWSKFKPRRRRAKARSAETLETAVTEALKTLTAENAVAWFRHCGYRDTPTIEQL
jgi:transposase